jgi:molecular chaperone DnaJ
MNQPAQRAFYAALGLEEGDRATMIHGAYRDLAHRLHPSRIGPGGRSNFRAIAEAYGVLSEPSLRRRYDAAGSRADGGTTPAAARDPLARQPAVTSLQRASLITRAREALFARFARNFSGLGVPKSESVDCLTICFVIAPREVGGRVVIRLGLPVRVRCTDCAGRGATPFVRCGACDGDGLVDAERSLDVILGPGGSASVGLERLGIHNLFLRALLRVDPALN